MKVTSIKKVKLLCVEKAVTQTNKKQRKIFDRILKMGGDLTLGGNNVP